MKILLLGKNGQVGWELQRSLAPVGELVALARDSRDKCGDLADLAGIAQTIREAAPDIIVNAAAYTAVDKAEEEKDTAFLINARAPGVLAREAARCGALLVHYSTDYVFDGSGDKAWRESDTTAPLNVYGASKLEGERAIRASGCRHLIFRSSWIYAARGDNFARMMLRLAGERDQLSVVSDQIGAPTGAELVADITAHAVRLAQEKRELEGIYHLAAGGETSWFDYTRFVLDYAGQAGVRLKASRDAVIPITSRDFIRPAKRPLNSRLDTAKLCKTFGVYPPDWRVGVARMLAEILD